ncbi:hypothetical protein HY346_02210 [Candidatus Microgenomates bacterium]|nr:hypothetical protein [Candidatus Microgenomates bacterium]
MLMQSQQLTAAQVVSIHSSQAIARLSDAIISPHQLEVVGYYAEPPQKRPEPLVLLASDIRQANPKRVFINSIDELTPVSDLVRLQEIIDLKFSLIGKPVKTLSHRRLGKVEEYVIDTLNWQVRKLYVKQSVLKNLSLQSLVIDRNQIAEVSDREITVNDAIITKPVVAPQQIA